jgi:hypothetical protein
VKPLPVARSVGRPFGNFRKSLPQVSGSELCTGEPLERRALLCTGAQLLLVRSTGEEPRGSDLRLRQQTRRAR